MKDGMLQPSDLILKTLQRRWIPTLHNLLKFKFPKTYDACEYIVAECYLCEYYFNFLCAERCSFCPISKMTKGPFCGKTPFFFFKHSHHLEDMIRYAREEVSFLWSLYSFYRLRPEINLPLKDSESFFKHLREDGYNWYDIEQYSLENPGLYF